MSKLTVFLLINIAILVLGSSLVFVSVFAFTKGSQNEFLLLLGLLGGILSAIGLFLTIDIRLFQHQVNKRNVSTRSFTSY